MTPGWPTTADAVLTASAESRYLVMCARRVSGCFEVMWLCLLTCCVSCCRRMEDVTTCYALSVDRTSVGAALSDWQQKMEKHTYKNMSVRTTENSLPVLPLLSPAAHHFVTLKSVLFKKIKREMRSDWNKKQKFTSCEVFWPRHVILYHGQQRALNNKNDKAVTWQVPFGNFRKANI